MNIKAMLICIGRLSDGQLTAIAAEEQTKCNNARLSKQERKEAYIRHLLILNAASERQWQERHSRLQTTKD